MSEKVSMKFICATFGIAVMCAVGAGAQTGTTETKTKTEVTDGKETVVIGCLSRTTGGGYMLLESADDARVVVRYTLVTDDDLAEHIDNHRIEVRGILADRRDGSVTVDQRVITSGNDQTHLRTVVTGAEMADTRFLGVKSVKMVSGSCK
jgi:hypothetical protein